MTPAKLEQLVAQLQALTGALPSEAPPAFSPGKARHLRQAVTEAYDRLRHLVEAMDPIKNPGLVFDPTNPNVAGRIVGITMIAQPRKQLASVDRFYGSGVYAIYYKGGYAGYASISRREHPIYVGKADPADPSAKTAKEQGDRLCRRISDHRKNIAKAQTTLRLEDFEYRVLVVQTGWQAAAEQYLIHLFKPIWNSEIGVCYGFGKHGDDPATRANLRSPWDTLHPGRDWAHRDPTMKDAKTERKILSEIAAHFAKRPPVSSTDEILRGFLAEIGTLS